MSQALMLRIKARLRPVTALLSVSYRWQPGIQEDKNIGLGELLPELWRKRVFLRARFNVVPTRPQIANQSCLARRTRSHDHNAWAMLSLIIHAKTSA
jgi:hypothetical protein